MGAIKYEIKIVVAGKTHTLYRYAASSDHAVLLARIEMAKRTGHIPDPWAIRVDDYSVRQIRRD